MYYIFDIDNTLLFTNVLNSTAYNYALTKLGYHTITTSHRLTRADIQTVFPNITNEEIQRIIAIKQAYCISHPEHAMLNQKMIDILRRLPSKNCIFWSSADLKRILSLLDYYDLNKYANYLIFDNKYNINNSILMLCKKVNCFPSDLIVFEDDTTVIQELHKHHVKVFSVADKITFSQLISKND